MSDISPGPTNADRILVVEDDGSIRRILRLQLEAAGYEVTEAENGIVALRVLETEMPDLVLLDIWMPEMDGIKTLIKIKEEYPHLQVIMMSGHGTIETAVKATKLGAYDFIEKPLSLENLLLSIQNALDYYQLEEEVSLLKEKNKKK